VTHFTGKERDTESGLDMFGARYYGSSIGRFMTPDWASAPIAVPYAELGNPQSLNLYSYTKNNPTTLTDIDGHCDIDVEGGKTEHHWGWCIWHTLGFYQTQPEIQRAADQARANLAGMNILIHCCPAKAGCVDCK
jgi:RHS repeat-associated protein